MYQNCGFEGGNLNMDVRELLEQVKANEKKMNASRSTE